MHVLMYTNRNQRWLMTTYLVYSISVPHSVAAALAVEVFEDAVVAPVQTEEAAALD